MSKMLKFIGACAAIAVLWVLLQLVLNLGALFIANFRGEGQWWLTIMKNIVSPALAAYMSFNLVERFYEAAPWKILSAFALLALLAYTAWSISFNSEHYLLANRAEEWRSVLWGTLFSTASAIVGVLVFCVSKLRPANTV